MFKVNPLSVLFHEKFDKVNDYSIYVFNPKKSTIRKVNPSAYEILKFIDDKKGVSEKEYINFCKMNGISQKDALLFIHDMVKENVVFIVK